MSIDDIEKVDLLFMDLIDHLLCESREISVIKKDDRFSESRGNTKTDNRYQLVDDIFAHYPFQPNDAVIWQIKMAAAVIFRERQKKKNSLPELPPEIQLSFGEDGEAFFGKNGNVSEEEKKQEEDTNKGESLPERKLRLAAEDEVDLYDLLEGFALFHPEKQSQVQRYLITTTLERLYLYDNFEEWRQDISGGRREILQERLPKIKDLYLADRPPRPSPYTRQEMNCLVCECYFSAEFEAAASFLSAYGALTFYSPKENLSEMNAKKLAKKISRACQPYTWKEYAKLFGDKLAFATIKPKHPPLMVLHSTPYARLEECLRHLAAIFQRQGYKALHIDGRRFTSRNEEPYPLFGSPSVWTGSRPGLLTSFVYDNPKTLVIIHDADKMNPVMFETLAGAFKEKNIITDEYGLENRERDRREAAMPATPVDFSHCIFLLTTSAGSHLYERPDINQFSQDHLESRAFAGLESSIFIPSGKSDSTDPTFSTEFLDLMRGGFVPLPPLNILDRIEHQRPIFVRQLDSATQRLEYRLEYKKDQMNLIVAALLLSERHNRRSFDDLATELIRPAYMAGNEKRKISLKVSNKAKEILAPYLQMEQPQSYLQKRGRTLTPVFELIDGEYVLTNLREEKIYRQKDHEGSIRLLADYPTTRFTDIFGHQKIKEKLQEIIAVLKVEDDEETQRGVLLAGEPGVGKTMMAEAFAGEAQMAFVNVTGSELLYADAAERLQEILEKHSPCVVFIDEADSIPSRAGGSDFAPAVNRLLAMIQGINTDSNRAFWILATNYPERLDAALLRAGRIEDTLHMRAPRDLQAREEYLQHFPLTEKQRAVLAKITIGFTGAMFEQLHRKVKRLKTRKKRLEKDDLYQLVIEIQHGDDMNSRPASAEYERCTAYHEAGHAVAQLCLGVNSAHLMLVLHNGEAVSGYLQTIDEEIRDRTPASVEKDLIVYLAGRGAEELIFGAATMGCSSDLQRAGELAYYAASKVGFMPEKTGLYISPLTYKSEDVEKNYEAAAAEMVNQAWEKTQILLRKKEPLLREIAEKLIKKRLLDNDALRKMHQKFESKAAEEENHDDA